MKKLIVFAMFLCVACQGPMGPPGSMGLMGDPGEDGRAGRDGRDAGAIDIIADFNDQIAVYERSVVNLECNVRLADGTFGWVRGTATKISNTEALTAYHVIENAVHCNLYYLNNTYAVIPNPTFMQPVVNDKLQDVAIITDIKFTDKGLVLDSVPFDDNYRAREGELVGLISYPEAFDKYPVYTFGRVAVPSAALGDAQQDCMVVDLVSWHGSSGGPLFNTQGVIVGVLVAGYDMINYDLRFVNNLRNL